MMLYSKLGLEMTLEAAKAEAMNLEIAVKSRNIVHGEDSEVDMQDGQVLAIHAGPSRGFSGSRGHEEQNLDYWADSKVMENDEGSESSSSDWINSSRRASPVFQARDAMRLYSSGTSAYAKVVKVRDDQK